LQFSIFTVKTGDESTLGVFVDFLEVDVGNGDVGVFEVVDEC